ncbi:MAG: Flp pilus assembly protein RcpC/CpaB [Hydrogenibacillus schlegelii]|uniref:Flp pilus assembly protein RcpC/CpaB n=1 Tax=Hydrogenibacillus schlegelii TaxID=1484 RepID=A0A2T5G426_HYDSH|nr:SAF domain-containing protein [Hydrogenibacillus schlegelii]PTQ50936.1 MAG: Flp pilus assembly protein RcpC/CpaB [Hydrogenibacillus schlegelii]
MISLKSLRRMLPLLFGFVLAIAAAATTWIALQSETPKRTVLVATKTLPIGHVIAEGDVAVRSLPAEAVPEEALRSPQDALGKAITGGPVLSGDVLRTEHVLPVSGLVSGLATLAPDGWTAVELPAETAKGLKGIRRGDRVAIVTLPLQTKDGQGNVVVHDGGLLAREAVILATPWVGAGGETRNDGGGGEAGQYVVAVPPEDAVRIAQAEVAGQKVALIVLPHEGAEDVIRKIETKTGVVKP